MECNRDEATRAKEIAERKFVEKEFPAAKKFAIKAQNLYPGLEGLPQMLATFDVYISSEKRIGGELDLYGILGANPTADEETIRKQYRKLALMLHPDKNKSIGADGAFKMISEAWSVLCDKNKRTEYDQRLLKMSQQKVPSAGGAHAPQPGTNGFHNFSNNASPKVGSQKNAARAAAAPRQPKPNTFWTVCHRCKMQYEYLRVYLNHNLLCPNCHEPFYALETAPPPSNGSNATSAWPSSQQRPKSNPQAANKNTGPAGFTGQNSPNQTNFQWGPFSKTAGAGSASASPSTAAQAASVVHQAYEKVRREREEAQAAAKRQEALRKKSNKRAAGNLPPKSERPAKKRNINEEGRSNFGVNVPDRMTTGNGSMYGIPGVKHGGQDRDRVYAPTFIIKPNSTRELTQMEIRNMLAEKARKEIQKKMKEWSLNAAAKVLEKGKGKETDGVKDGDKQTVAKNSDLTDKQKPVEPSGPKKVTEDKTESLDTSDINLNTEVREPISITVPDPDFHDFDRDRSERCFGENQVWAAYDDDDGMPRYYALVHKVISSNHFKMKISWLNSKTNSELSPLNWVGSGFAKTCGDFRVGKHELNNSLNSFSHRVKWTKGTRGAVRIYPRKGDVWALYRNWSPDWNELTPDAVIHKYDMVEVLDDYNEEQGVFVSPLVKVAGFKTVFHRHLDDAKVQKIPRDEMFRFSHQVPSYLLTGSEAHNAPKGCRELDPAATPLELLQVIEEAKEVMSESAKECTMNDADEVVVIQDSPEENTIVETDGNRTATQDNVEENTKVETKGKKVGENAEEHIITYKKKSSVDNAGKQKQALEKEATRKADKQMIADTDVEKNQKAA